MSPSRQIVPHRELSTDAPPMLTPRADCVAQVQGRWFLAEVRAGREKSLAWRCVDLGLDYYLPIAERVRIRNGIRRRSAVPLFPNYFFGAGDAADTYCRESPNVLGMIPVSDQRQLVRELSNLEIALFANPRLEVVGVSDVGQRVRVTGGQYEGVEGKVEGFHDAKGMTRVYIKVSIMGGAQLDIDRADLEAI